jgi:negative regulator of sigma E activity
VEDQVEQSASQLSAMFDGELSSDECELLSRRLSRDEALRSRWARYALVGAALRAEPMAPASGNFARRVGAAIDEQSVQHQGKKISGFRRLRTAALGGTLAAGVAAMAVFALRSEVLVRNQSLTAFTPTVVRVDMPMAAGPVTGVAANASSREPASYIVPRAGNGSDLALPVSLADYAVVHSEYSSPLARRGLISSLVGSETIAAEVNPGYEIRVVEETGAGAK